MTTGTSYQDSGDGPAPMLMLLHPLGGDRRFWRGCMAHWAPHRRVVAYDRAGAGSSPVPARFLTQAEQVAELEALRAQLGIARMVPIGVAVGAMIAAAYAAAHPNRVAALVLSDPALRIATAGRAMSFERIAKVKSSGIAALFPDIIDKAFHGLPHDAVYHDYSAQFRGNDPRGYEMNVLAALDLDIAEALPRITAPTLVTVGEHDQLFPPKEAETVAAMIPGARLVKLANASHFPPLQNQAAFTATIDAFLAAVEAG